VQRRPSRRREGTISKRAKASDRARLLSRDRGRRMIEPASDEGAISLRPRATLSLVVCALAAFAASPLDASASGQAIFDECYFSSAATAWSQALRSLACLPKAAVSDTQRTMSEESTTPDLAATVRSGFAALNSERAPQGLSHLELGGRRAAPRETTTYDLTPTSRRRFAMAGSTPDR